VLKGHTRFPGPGGSSLPLDLVPILGAMVLVLRVVLVLVEPLLELVAELVDHGIVVLLDLLGLHQGLGVPLLLIDDELHEVHVVFASGLEILRIVLVFLENGHLVLDLVVGLLVGERTDDHLHEGLFALDGACLLVHPGVDRHGGDYFGN